jgi:adenylate kinase family enzyme
MSGAPGSGKTTLAHAIARHISAVVIDHDVTKSALLDADVPIALAGRASYQVLDAVARHLLRQGHTVVFDSPCFYTELLERGQRLAQEAQVPYRYIECVVEDLDELDRRLRTRPRLPSQLTGVYVRPSEGSGKIQSGEAIFRDWITNMKRPATNYLVLDTTLPLDVCLKTALAYITTGVGHR